MTRTSIKVFLLCCLVSFTFRILHLHNSFSTSKQISSRNSHTDTNFLSVFDSPSCGKACICLSLRYLELALNNKKICDARNSRFFFYSLMQQMLLNESTISGILVSASPLNCPFLSTMIRFERVLQFLSFLSKCVWYVLIECYQIARTLFRNETNKIQNYLSLLFFLS
jgi:hypothetical protein